MRARPAVLLALMSTLLLTGCLPPAEDPGRAPATDRSGAGEPVDPDDGTDTPEEFANDIGASRSVAERYWTAVFRQSGTGFEPIRQVVPYERDGELDCAGEPLPRNNAVYCPAGDFIAYDVNWAFAAFRQIGDAFVYYLLGHEYAHGIQARLGIRKQFTIEQELQADCMAGAFIGDKARDGDLTMQDNDTRELADGLAAVGDQPGQPWFAEGAHGTAEQRMDAFAKGYQSSLDECGL
ncbi:neutral zinc metallopeptidase [Actinoplanes aureus]|uniref:Neutral zinc metallopeptidase n=1 Tax=Actinoplanes aureus TaxID=2792083 RepID=A0A931G3Y8_9ACTN|nr:neutral zinc metallopeptidase [Actinoplanes aureus]MBG0567436.1 neutral zinc metallopeptidase [Actinoplanes aureus]